MNALEAFILGVVQGATEFLPVSSSGHLVIGQNMLGIDVDGVLFEVVVHVATLVSVVWVYRERLLELLRGVVRREREAWAYVGLLAVATVPVGFIGSFYLAPLEALFDRPVVPGVGLIVTGVILWSSRAALARAVATRPTWWAAAAIGAAQAFALVPGVSRSGATVVAALWLGIEAREAAAFSFLMAVPAIAGAALSQVPALEAHLGPGALPLLAGGIAAGVTGILAIRTFVSMLSRRYLHWFAPYTWTVGAVYLLYLGMR